MWLEGGDQPARTEFPSGLESRRHLCGMVRVVVVDAGPAQLALQLQAPAHAREVRQRASARLDVRGGEGKPAERCERVGDVVAPREPQRNFGVDPGAARSEAGATTALGRDA